MLYPELLVFLLALSSSIFLTNKTYMFTQPPSQFTLRKEQNFESVVFPATAAVFSIQQSLNP